MLGCSIFCSCTLKTILNGLDYLSIDFLHSLVKECFEMKVQIEQLALGK